MELAKKNDQDLFIFEISSLARVGRKVCVVQDFKVEVMKPANVS